jgi:hypothetical protein
MPVAVAEYLRHLATRCSRMSRDCTDQVIGKELEQISVELVEKAEILEAHFSIPQPTDNPTDLVWAETSNIGDDDKR